jgi:hypothetical protein
MWFKLKFPGPSIFITSSSTSMSILKVCLEGYLHHIFFPSCQILCIFIQFSKFSPSDPVLPYLLIGTNTNGIMGKYAMMDLCFAADIRDN